MTGHRVPLYVAAVDLGRVLTQRPGFPLTGAITQILREQGLEGADVAVETAINNNQAIVLVDGLDEVAQDDQRAAVFEALRRDIGGNRAILSSRPVAYQEGALSGWRICEVQQLDDELQLLLIGSVLQQIRQQTGRTIEIEPVALKNELENRDDLRVWAGNPLLLTLITTQYALNGSLPSERAVIYRLALDRLIDSPYRQTPPRQYRIERDRLEEMLERLGLRMMERSLISVDLIASPEADRDEERQPQRRRRRNSNTLSQDDIAHLASPTDAPLDEETVEEFVDRVGVIQRQSTNKYGFIHLTFQEYCRPRAGNLQDGRQRPY
jgi:predicted NACHT family NTPase